MPNSPTRVRDFVLALPLAFLCTAAFADSGDGRDPTWSRLVTGNRGAVAAEHILASRAGVEILDAGGNAVDAAAAASLAGAVVNPASAGLGGGGFMVIFAARDGRAHALDYRETAPGSAHRDMYVREDGSVDGEASKRGGKAVGVPGEIAGLELALARFGTMTPRQVTIPALRLAEQGFIVEPHLADGLEKRRDAIAADPALAAELLKPDGTPYQAGDLMKRPGLAKALRAFSDHGAGPFYKGEIAREIAAAVEAGGGNMTYNDLARYKVEQRPPVVIDYGRYRVIGMPPPSSGGGVIGEVLGIMSNDRLEELGQNTPTYLHLLAESLKAAFADRAQRYGDPDYFNVGLDQLLAGPRLREIRNNISPARAAPSSRYGDVGVPDDSGTAHISVIDAAGNAVSCTTSINTSFGAKIGTATTGIPLNNTMDDFSAQPGVPNAYGLIGSEANSIEAGKRPLSSMSPTIVLENGRARLAVGGSGGPLIITGTLQTLINVLAFSDNVADGVSRPRIHHQWMPERLLIEPRVDEATRDTLARRGHEVTVFPRSAAVQAVEVLKIDGRRVVRAASDARKGGLAAAQR